MSHLSSLEQWSKITESILRPPFEWCHVMGGAVVLRDASGEGGTRGGSFTVGDFALARYPITNAQYESFLKHSNGFANTQWWEFSPEAAQWRKDHQEPKPTAFDGFYLPRTRVSWFDSMAFCSWLSAQVKDALPDQEPSNAADAFTWPIRLPTEQEWQRAALGDTGWCYPWGNDLDERRGNYANHVGQPSPVDRYPDGQSLFGVMDMIGNLWERCLTGWNQESVDIRGYTYRVIKGGAWNIGNPEYLRANDRGCHPPRGQLNDCGFRVLLDFGLQSQQAG